MDNSALDFLLNKQGWIKKRPIDLQERFENMGKAFSIDEIKELQAEARKQIKSPLEPKEKPKKKTKGRLKKKWVMPNGDTGYSYEFDRNEEAEEYVLERIEKIVKDGIRPIRLPKRKKSNNRSMLSVFTTDKHIGARTAANSMYENIYDKNEIYRRHGELVNRMIKQKEKFGKFEKFVFYDLGDAVDGASNSTVRGGHTLPQNMDDREQIDCFIEVTIKTFEKFVEADIADEIWFVATTNDNHAGSFGHGAVRAIQLYLETKYPDLIRTNVSSKLLDHIEFGKHTYIFGHGKDDGDMRAGMPLNLDPKTEGFINDYIDRKRINSPYIHVVKGDLHQSSENYAKRFRYKNNMSMYGASKYIHTNFGSGDSGVDYEITELDTEEIWRSRITFGRDR